MCEFLVRGKKITFSNLSSLQEGKSKKLGYFLASSINGELRMRIQGR